MEEKPVTSGRRGWEGFAALACVAVYAGMQLTLALSNPMFKMFPLHLLEVLSPSAETNDWQDPAFRYMRGGTETIIWCIVLLVLLVSTLSLAYSAIRRGGANKWLGRSALFILVALWGCSLALSLIAH